MFCFCWIKFYSRVIFLGDLNYRISLPEEKTRLLVESKKWNILLENDQVIIYICIFFYVLKVVNSLLFSYTYICFVILKLSWGWRSWTARFSEGGKKELSNLLQRINTFQIRIYITDALHTKKTRRNELLHGTYNVL